MDGEGIQKAEDRLTKLLRQFTDALSREADQLATQESEAKAHRSLRASQNDRQRNIQLTELSNRTVANSLKLRQELFDVLSSFVERPNSSVVRYLNIGDIDSIVIAGIADRVSGIPAIVPLFDHGSIAVLGNEDLGLNVISSLAFRVINSAPIRSVITHFINPDLHDEMSVFSALNSGGSREFRSAVSADEIKETIAFLVQQVQETQQLLQGEYANLGDYLEKRSGRDQRRYHLLCVAGRSESLKPYMSQIFQLMKQSPRYGVSTLIQVDPSEPEETLMTVKQLERDGLLSAIEVTDLTSLRVSLGGGQFSFKMPKLDVSMTRSRLIEIADAGGRLKSPDVSIARTLPKSLWGENSKQGLTTCLGEQGDQRVEITIGESTRNLNNVLVGGSAGSGKTVLLLTLIYGLAYRYSPDELNMYLLDYKEGVEFARFASDDGYLPHARIVGIESDEVLGTAVLKSLLEEMTARSQLFKSEGVEKISEYRDKGKGLPRILLVVDEFQLMVRADVNFTLLNDVVRRGRSFGIHVVLSSQTPSGLGGAMTELFQQVKLRICTKSAPDTSANILGDGNHAAAELEGPPEAIVNEDFGQIFANRKIRVARGTSDELTSLDRRFHGPECQFCGEMPFKRGQSTCLKCSNPLPNTPQGRRPLAVRESQFASGSEIRRAPAQKNLVDWKLGVDCSLGRPFNPRIEHMTLTFAEPYSHMMVIGRGQKEAQGIIQNSLIQLALKTLGGMTFIFGQSKHHDAKSSGMTSELTDLIDRAGHYVKYVSDDKQLSKILKSKSLPETRTFVVLPEADQFEQPEVDYDEKGLLEHILEEGHRTGVHVIGWWELQNSPKRVHKDYQSLPVRKVLLNVTKGEVDDMGSQDWGWRAGRAFFWDTPNLDGGNWFVPFEPPEPSMLREALNDLKATNG
jgi:hypothetical protein